VRALVRERGVGQLDDRAGGTVARGIRPRDHREARIRASAGPDERAFAVCAFAASAFAVCAFAVSTVSTHHDHTRPPGRTRRRRPVSATRNCPVHRGPSRPRRTTAPVPGHTRHVRAD
jgi:hypothetical protein